RGVTKAVRDLIDGVLQRSEVDTPHDEMFTVPAELLQDERQLAKELNRLEQKMLEHAKNLEFELAAQARDELNHLKDQALLR
ncbi:MAG TPA: UvrB/UvrC motif-containing protein, partial [Paenalcaligenes sp.]|nr:UvrB/UvrC motif-containing protein [Paenalcaligenes sp.]